MANETGYPDSVARGEDTHPGSQANHNAEAARKEEAAPGHEGRSDNNTPIGSQSGFAKLMSSETPHGESNDEADYRREDGSGY